MITIAIPGHECIRLRRFYYEATFSGLLEGSPTARMIAERFDEARRDTKGIDKSFRSKVVGRFKPADYVLYEESYDRENVPAYYCIAYLESMTPTDPEFMFSYVTVSWFMDIDFERRIDECIADALLEFDWKRYAKNGDW